MGDTTVAMDGREIISCTPEVTADIWRCTIDVLDVHISITTTRNEHVKILKNHSNELVAVCAVVWGGFDIGVDIVDGGYVVHNSRCEV